MGVLPMASSTLSQILFKRGHPLELTGHVYGVADAVADAVADEAAAASLALDLLLGAILVVVVVLEGKGRRGS
jgi:hypothetical protein